MKLLFTSLTLQDEYTYDFNGIKDLRLTTIVSRHKTDILDGFGEPIWCKQIYNSLSYEYVTISKVISGVPKGAIVMCWDGTRYKEEYPVHGENTPRSVEDVINSLNKLKAHLVEPFDNPDIRFSIEWRSGAYNLMSYIPHGWMPVRFDYNGKKYCIYKYKGVQIVHCFNDNDEYILG